MRKTKLLIAAITLSVFMSSTALAGEWKQDSAGWWYQNDDGSYPTNTWLQANSNWYYFDTNGYVLTGWLRGNDTNWYYLNSSGEMQTTSITLEDGVTYNFDSTGSCLNRWAGAADMNYYDPYTGTIKNVSYELSERDVIDKYTTVKIEFENSKYQDSDDYDSYDLDGLY